MSYWPFVRLAKKAEANYPIRKIAIVDLNILDDFLEGNPEVVSELKKRRKKSIIDRCRSTGKSDSKSWICRAR